AAAAIETFWRDDQFSKSVQAKAAMLTQRLRAIAEKHNKGLIKVKGRGLMQGIDCGSGELAAAVSRAAFARGLVIETSGPDSEVVKCLCPLTISNEDLTRGLDILDESVTVAVASQRKPLSNVVAA